MNRKKESVLHRILVKLTSIKTLITMWSLFMLTFIVVNSLSYPVLEPLLAAIPLSYFGVNLAEKVILKQSN